MLAICNIDTHDIHIRIYQVNQACLRNYYIIIVLLHNYYIHMHNYVCKL